MFTFVLLCVATSYGNLELVHLHWASPRQRVLNNTNRTAGRQAYNPFVTGDFYTDTISHCVCYWTMQCNSIVSDG